MTAVDRSSCPCCGDTRRVREPVLWSELIAEWRLSAPEADSIDRREGVRCAGCGASLRSMALASANTRPLSLVPDLHGLVRILESVGFSRVEILPPPADGYEQFVRARRAMVAAWV